MNRIIFAEWRLNIITPFRRMNSSGNGNTVQAGPNCGLTLSDGVEVNFSRFAAFRRSLPRGLETGKR